MNIILHPHYSGSLRRFLAVLDRPAHGRLIFLVGPTGTGKTTICHSGLRTHVGNPEHWGHGRVPLIEAYAPLSTNAFFNSKALVESLVAELHAPSLLWLLGFDNTEPSPAALRLRVEIDRAKVAMESSTPKSYSESRLWNLFADLARARQTHLVSIEQAGSLCITRKNKQPADHILHLMALAERLGMTFILTGVPSMSDLWMSRPEIRRRADVVWVPPYNPKLKEDVRHFMALLRTLEQRYPFEAMVVRSMSSDIFAATAGILGEVLRLFADAKTRSAQDGRSLIARDDITASVHSDVALRQMWADVLLFEELRTPGATVPYKKLIVAPASSAMVKAG